jgi:protein TonB
MRLVRFALSLSSLISVQALGQTQGPADYPPEAMKNGSEGDVVADLTISPEGRVSACKVIQSSGHQVLNDATCDLLIKRARFKPATDANGRPAEDHIRTPPIAWRIGP